MPAAEDRRIDPEGMLREASEVSVRAHVLMRTVGRPGLVRNICINGPLWWADLAELCARRLSGDRRGRDDDFAVMTKSIGLWGGHGAMRQTNPPEYASPDTCDSCLMFLMGVTPVLWSGQWAYRSLLGHDESGLLRHAESRTDRWTTRVWADSRTNISQDRAAMAELGAGLCQSSRDCLTVLEGFRSAVGQVDVAPCPAEVRAWAAETARLAGAVRDAVLSGIAWADSGQRRRTLRAVSELDGFLVRTWTSGACGTTIRPVPMRSSLRPGPTTDASEIRRLWDGRSETPLGCVAIQARGTVFSLTSSNGIGWGVRTKQAHDKSMSLCRHAMSVADCTDAHAATGLIEAVERTCRLVRTHCELVAGAS